MIDEKYSDKWREWLTVRTRNQTNMTANICNSNHVNDVSRMIVDDVTEITPTAKYEFPDGNYHTVRILLKDPTNLPSGFFQSITSQCLVYCRLPYGLASMGTYGLRGLGASQDCIIIFKNPVPPTRANNNTGLTKAIIYVPEGSLDTYKNDPNYGLIASKINSMSMYTQRYY